MSENLFVVQLWHWVLDEPRSHATTEYVGSLDFVTRESADGGVFDTHVVLKDENLNVVLVARMDLVALIVPARSPGGQPC